MNTQSTGNVATLTIEQLIPFSLGNSRIKHDAAARNQLKESIKEAGGVLQPILVRPTADEAIFEVVAGFGRYEACKELGFSVPSLIKTMTDTEAYEYQLVENLVRQDLSIVDEAKAAQKFITMYEGDYTAAAERLGWTQKKINDRIQLMRCSTGVLDALNADKIKIGHAVVLSSFSEKLQNGTLEKIISEDWSVQYLKERAGKAKKFLHTAKFDTADCAACPHNTSHQMGMFDFEADDKAACAKLACWNVKTDEWLKEQKELAEQKFGKVILFVECDNADRNTVAASVVGDKQFNEGCSNCESNVVVMDDRSGREGHTIESQCIDKICFTKCTKALVESTKTPPATTQTEPSNSTKEIEKKGGEKTITKETATPIQQKTPSAVLEAEKALIHTIAKDIYQGEAWYVNGLILASLVVSTSYKPDFMKGMCDFTDYVIAGKSVPLEDMQKEINNAVLQSVSNNAECVDSRFVLNQQKLMIKALGTHDDKVALLTSAWIPSEGVLKAYTSQGIKGLCESAGFDKAFNDDAENKAAKVTFAKVAAKSKGDLIKAITSFSFDWSGFAPDTLLTHF